MQKQLIGNQRRFLQWVYDEKSSSLSDIECIQIKRILNDASRTYVVNGTFQRTFNKCRDLYQTQFLLSMNRRFKKINI